MMKLNHRNLDKFLSHKPKPARHQIRSFYMQWFARLIECKFIEELRDLVIFGRTVLTSQFKTQEVDSAIPTIQTVL